MESLNNAGVNHDLGTSRNRLSLSSTISDLETIIVRHPLHNEVIEAIDALHSRYSASGKQMRLKARGLLIVGESGAGKTTALEDYASKFPERCLEDVIDGKVDGVIIPAEVIDKLKDRNMKRVLLVETPKRPSQRAFVAAIIGSMGYRARDHWNTDEIINKIAFYADQLGIEIILIDEGHHIVHEQNADATRDLIDFLKSLLNRIKVPIVIAGLPKLLDIQNSKLDLQMARRLQPAVILRPYDWRYRTGRVRFMALLKRFEDLIALPEPSNLSDQKTAGRMYVATGGAVGWVSKYLSRCCELVAIRGLPSISLSLLSEVHASFDQQYNQIEDKIDFVVLLDEGEIKTRGTPALEDDPFLCDFKRLAEIWKDRVSGIDIRSKIDDGVEDESDRSRKTMMTAKGRGSYSPFQSS